LSARLRPRIRLAGDLFRVGILLFDHEVVRVPRDDALDVGHFMARNHGEMGRFRAQRLVVAHGHRDLLRTGSVAALAAEVDPALAREELLCDLGHALIHLSEEGFVGAETLLARSHRAIVCRSVRPCKVGTWRTGKALSANWHMGVHVVQAEDVFRSANERIAEKGRELGWRFPVPFLCECADTHCFARLELPLEVYEDLRSDPQLYLTAPGHEIPGAIVMERTESFALAEKLYAPR
jgi:hypothetical protein